jgi:hypothetical protein
LSDVRETMYFNSHISVNLSWVWLSSDKNLRLTSNKWKWRDESCAHPISFQTSLLLLDNNNNNK